MASELIKAFCKKHKIAVYENYYDSHDVDCGLNEPADHLPCFAHRWTVRDFMNNEEIIQEYIKAASESDENDVLVFSVTEKDKCWKAWASFAKAHPRTFKVVQGGSIHGNYQCRMYIHVKPKSKRKYNK